MHYIRYIIKIFSADLLTIASPDQLILIQSLPNSFPLFPYNYAEYALLSADIRSRDLKRIVI